MSNRRPNRTPAPDSTATPAPSTDSTDLEAPVTTVTEPSTDPTDLEDSTVTTDPSTDSTPTGEGDAPAPDSTPEAPSTEHTPTDAERFQTALDSAIGAAVPGDDGATIPDAELTGLQSAYVALKGAARNAAIKSIADRMSTVAKARDWSAMDALTAANDAVMSASSKRTTEHTPADPYAAPVRQLIAVYMARAILDSGVTLSEGVELSTVNERASSVWNVVSTLDDDSSARVTAVFGGQASADALQSDAERDALQALQDGYALATGAGVKRAGKRSSSGSTGTRASGDERNDIPAVIGDVLALFPAGHSLKASEIANVANGKDSEHPAPASVRCPVSNGAVSAALESVGAKLADGSDVAVTWRPTGGKRQLSGTDGPLSAHIPA